jgi:hypothetical protein
MYTLRHPYKTCLQSMLLSPALGRSRRSLEDSFRQKRDLANVHALHLSRTAIHKVQERLEQYCSDLQGVKIIDRGASFEVGWEDSFGALVHKDSDHKEAIVCWEASSYTPKEKRVEWSSLVTWLRENVRER